MKLLTLLFLLLFSITCHAVIKRHDIPAKNYAIEQTPDYMIDLPHEGHGVLIKPQWVVTVAHTIFYDYVGKKLTIGAQQYEIASVHIHPNYTKPNQNLLKGDMAPLMQFFRKRSDIALIKLTSPVANIKPINIYLDTNEQGMKIKVFGKGATGDGITGENLETKPLREINQFHNIVESASGNWLTFIFDKPVKALPLEGMPGSGDSGGASVVLHEGKPLLVGLSSWQMAHGEITHFKGGLYGTTAYQVRMSSYNDWILSIINNE